MGSGKKDEPEKGYITDENGNLIDPDTGEIVSPPEETEPGTETPSEPRRSPGHTGNAGDGNGDHRPLWLHRGRDGHWQSGDTGPAGRSRHHRGAAGGTCNARCESGLDPVTGEPLPMGG